MNIYVPKTKTTRKKLLPIGDFDGLVTNVDWAEEYRKNSMVRISYQLTDATGKQYSYSELFRISPPTDRTREFSSYLEENGITDWTDFTGCHEKLTIKRDTKGQFRTIDEREFISGPTTDVETE